MEKQKLIENIKTYLEIAIEERRRYPLEQVGVWRVVGGDGGDGARRELGVYGGRFLDAVAKAVQTYGFYESADYSSIIKRRSTRNVGYVVPYVAPQIIELEKEIEPSDLEAKVKS